LDISGWENFVRRFLGGFGIFIVMLLTIAMNVIGMSVVGTSTVNLINSRVQKPVRIPPNTVAPKLVPSRPRI